MHNSADIDTRTSSIDFTTQYKQPSVNRVLRGKSAKDKEVYSRLPESQQAPLQLSLNDSDATDQITPHYAFCARKRRKTSAPGLAQKTRALENWAGPLAIIAEYSQLKVAKQPLNLSLWCAVKR